MQNVRLKPKFIAIYLPQYHPIPENDEWWGKGFTEWTNVTKATPRFRGHYQPQLPADLGYYDLRLSETREAQAELAQEYGISGFCYYHYWFHGKRMLERPFNEVLASGKPDFPFCLCWANENWTRTWDGLEKSILVRQQYSPEDDLAHIRHLASAFEDQRYIRVDGKPLFLIYRSSLLPNIRETLERWRNEAHHMGVGELFLVKVIRTIEDAVDPIKDGFDAGMDFHPYGPYLGLPYPSGILGRIARRAGLLDALYGRSLLYPYDQYVTNLLNRRPPNYPSIPSAFPSWDNSSRKSESLIMIDSTPEKYKRLLMESAKQAISRPVGNDNAIVFINAWNEWAEGNHLEPCHKWGRQYLEATKAVLNELHA
jgi:lipopolysaccharide biosynthesis protein